MKNVKRLVVLSAILAVASGCASTVAPTRPAPVPEPPGMPDAGSRDAGVQAGPAVKALLDQADVELRAGATARAIAKLENALRIESRNPLVWQRLAQANLQVGRLDQAETLALRSISLGRGNPGLELDNWRVIAEARRGRGDRDGTAEAVEKVTALQERVER